MKRYYSILLSSIAIAQCLTLAATAPFPQPLEAKEYLPAASAKKIFVCTTETSVPTLYVYTSGKTSLTPLIIWHQDYLLPQDSGIKICEQVAQKLQHLSQEQQEIHINTEKKGEYTLVCTAKIQDQTCSSYDSKPLFTINPYYDSQCILERKEPLECVAIGRRVRGGLSIPDSPYKPVWWLW